MSLVGCWKSGQESQDNPPVTYALDRYINEGTEEVLLRRNSDEAWYQIGTLNYLRVASQEVILAYVAFCTVDFSELSISTCFGKNGRQMLERFRLHSQTTATVEIYMSDDSGNQWTQQCSLDLSRLPLDRSFSNHQLTIGRFPLFGSLYLNCTKSVFSKCYIMFTHVIQCKTQSSKQKKTPRLVAVLWENKKATAKQAHNPFNFDNVSYQIATKHDKFTTDRESILMYVITVFVNDQYYWHVLHRFTDFVILRNFLVMNNKEVPPFASLKGRLFLTYRSSKLQKRLQELEAFLLYYLHHASQLTMMSVCVLMSFLQIPEHFKDFSLTQSSEQLNRTFTESFMSNDSLLLLGGGAGDYGRPGNAIPIQAPSSPMAAALSTMYPLGASLNGAMLISDADQSMAEEASILGISELSVNPCNNSSLIANELLVETLSSPDANNNQSSNQSLSGMESIASTVKSLRRRSRQEFKQQNFEAALETCRAILDAFEHEADVDSYYSREKTSTLLDMAEIYGRKGLELESLAAYEKAATYLTAHQQEATAEYAFCRCCVGNYFMFRDEPDLHRALQEYTAALDAYRRIYGEHHMDVANCWVFVGQALVGLEEPAQGLAANESALAAVCGAVGSDIHEKAAVCWSNIGCCQRKLKRNLEAVKAFSEAIRINDALQAESAVPERYAEMAQLHYDIALIHLCDSNESDALAAAQLAVDAWKQRLFEGAELPNDDLSSVANSYRTLAELQLKLGQGALAIENGLSAVEWFEKAMNNEPRKDLAACYNVCADACQLEGQLDKALEFYTRTLDMTRSLFDSKHTAVATVLSNIGAVQEELGRYEKACESYKEAHSILLEAKGAKDGEVLELCRCIGNMYQALGEAGRALEYYILAEGNDDAEEEEGEEYS